MIDQENLESMNDVQVALCLEGWRTQLALYRDAELDVPAEKTAAMDSINQYKREQFRRANLARVPRDEQSLIQGL